MVTSLQQDFFSSLYFASSTGKGEMLMIVIIWMMMMIIPLVELVEDFSFHTTIVVVIVVVVVVVQYRYRYRWVYVVCVCVCDNFKWKNSWKIYRSISIFWIIIMTFGCYISKFFQVFFVIYVEMMMMIIYL